MEPADLSVIHKAAQQPKFTALEPEVVTAIAIYRVSNRVILRHTLN